jgi:ribosomal protein S18 acetylase RimI-like enzyme
MKQWVKRQLFRWFNICATHDAVPIDDQYGKRFWTSIEDEYPTEMMIWRHGKFCGLIRMSWQPDHLELWDIFVQDKYRGKGLGTAMLKWLVGYAEGRNITKIWAVVSPENPPDFDRVMGWYLHQGFRRKSPNSHVITMDLNNKE